MASFILIIGHSICKEYGISINKYEYQMEERKKGKKIKNGRKKNTYGMSILWIQQYRYSIGSISKEKEVVFYIHS